MYTQPWGSPEWFAEVEYLFSIEALKHLSPDESYSDYDYGDEDPNEGGIGFTEARDLPDLYEDEETVLFAIEE